MSDSSNPPSTPTRPPIPTTPHLERNANCEARTVQTDRRANRCSGVSEDWLSFWTGLGVLLLSLGVFLGPELLGFGLFLTLGFAFPASLKSETIVRVTKEVKTL